MLRKSPKQPKPKPCGYSECGKLFVPQRPFQVTCSIACARKYNEEKEVKKRVKQMESSLTKLSYYEQMAKQVFQKWVRLRDEKEGCISCYRKHSEQFDGGHYMKAEIYSGVIFNEMNVNKQCCYCNGPHMHGNLVEYRKGLVNKYGEEKVQELEVLANQTRNYKYTREELKEITIKYKTKIKNKDFGDLHQ
jgi:hypothetical protein